MQYDVYHHGLTTASSNPGHEACESRVEFLARSAAQLVEYYEGIVFTLARQRDAAQEELRVVKEHLALLQVTP